MAVASDTELIDTLWNVNGNNRRQNRERQSELIDTLWNVNKVEKQELATRKRINRYIMECKYYQYWLV